MATLVLVVLQIASHLTSQVHAGVYWLVNILSDTPAHEYTMFKFSGQPTLPRITGIFSPCLHLSFCVCVFALCTVEIFPVIQGLTQIHVARSDVNKQKEEVIHLRTRGEKWLWHVSGLKQKPETGWSPGRKEGPGLHRSSDKQLLGKACKCCWTRDVRATVILLRQQHRRLPQWGRFNPRFLPRYLVESNCILGTRVQNWFRQSKELVWYLKTQRVHQDNTRSESAMYEKNILPVFTPWVLLATGNPRF